MSNPPETTPVTECKCSTCQKMCKRPCWGTPEDIQKIIDAGFGDRLMKDAWFNVDDDFYLLCPALKGAEGKEAPFLARSERGCTFFKKGLCELHDLGLKPIEGKLAHCSREDSFDTHCWVGSAWNTQEGKKMAKEWEGEHLDENS